MNTDIKFLSYSGEYPTLCKGKLTTKINGNVITFGDKTVYVDVDYPQFWKTGGVIQFKDNEDSIPCCYVHGVQIKKSEWILDYHMEDYPHWFTVEIMQKLIDMMNNEVEYGCCGGCLKKIP